MKKWQDVRSAAASYRGTLTRMLGISPLPGKVQERKRPKRAKAPINALARYYSAPQAMAYPFQSLVFVTRLVEQLKAGEKVVADAKAAQEYAKVAQKKPKSGSHARALHERPVLLVDRSVLSDRNVFVESMKGKGILSHEQVAIYEAWYEGMLMATASRLVPDVLVYLRASPFTCMERLKARRRSEENAITPALLKSLHGAHERWLLGQTRPVTWNKRGRESRQVRGAWRARENGPEVRRPMRKSGRCSVPQDCQVRRFDRALGCHPVLHGRPVLVFDANFKAKGKGGDRRNVVSQLRSGSFPRFFWAFINDLRRRSQKGRNGNIDIS